MIKKIVIALLILVALFFLVPFVSTMLATNVFAEWTKVAVSDDGDQTSYIDNTNIKRKGNKVKVWHLLDYKTTKILADNTEYLSAVYHVEYDCEEKTERQLDTMAYSGNMRSVKLLLLFDALEEEATSIIPDTSSAGIFKKVCDGTFHYKH